MQMNYFSHSGYKALRPRKSQSQFICLMFNGHDSNINDSYNPNIYIYKHIHIHIYIYIAIPIYIYIVICIYTFT